MAEVDLDKMLEEAEQRWPGTLGLSSGPETRHEDTARHWRANAAEEKRKKQHVSKLLAEALKERDAALKRAERLEKALWKYGGHGDSCQAGNSEPFRNPCHCGWDEVVALLEGRAALVEE